MNLEDYRANIDRLIRESRSDVVLNGSPEHAAIITERMLANATSTVRILAQRLDPRIFAAPDTLEQAELFLADDTHSIELIVEDLDGDALAIHPFIERLRAFLGRNLHIKRLRSQFAAATDVNFSLMDDRGYRFETDKKEIVATAAFMPSSFVKQLQNLFERLYAESDVVEIPLAA